MSALIQKNWFLFKTVRIIFDDALFLNLIKERNYLGVVLVSHQKLDVPPGVRVKKKPTVLIELNKALEQILQSFNDTARNEIRRTFKLPELSFNTDHEDFSETYALYRFFRKRKGLSTRGKDFFKDALFFKAYWNGELISVITCYAAHPGIRIQNIFSKTAEGDKELRRMIGYATRRLVYEICAYGQERGFSFLDLAGINLTDQRKSGITAFKRSFGGDIADEYTYTYRSPMFSALMKLKKIL